MYYTDHRSLEAIAARHGSLADWQASDSEMVTGTLHARIDEAMQQMSEEDRLVLQLYGRDGIVQSRLAKMWGLRQSSVSERWSRAVRRLRYWMALSDLGGTLGRTLREVGAADEDSELTVSWLLGKPLTEVDQPHSTTWDAVDRVRKALRRSGSERAKRVLRVIKLRGLYPKV